MASLKRKDFSSPAKAGSFAGKSREEIIFLKIKEELPFILGAIKGGTKLYGKTYSKDTNELTYAKTKSKSKSIDLKTISIFKIFKDEDFGGGGARAKQADNTAITESGCAYYCSLVFNLIKRKLTPADCTKENLENPVVQRHVFASTSLNDFLKNGPSDWHDENVYMNTANAIWDKYKNKLKGPVYCHRGSKFMNNLYAAYKSALAWDRKPEGDKLAPGSFNADKWNPGDIWLSTLRPGKQPLKECRTFSDLKKCVLTFAGEGGLKKTTLLAVSLKKPGNPNKTKFERYNTKDRTHYKDGTVSYDGFTYGKRGDFFSSNDVYLYIGGKDIQFRGFNSSSGWQGNIIGTGALGGKIGGGNVDYYLQSAGIKSISRSPGIWRETQAPLVMDREIGLMHELYVKYSLRQKGNIGIDIDIVKDENRFKQLVIENGDNFKWQKYMGLLLINAMESADKEKQKLVAIELVRYAASNTALSTFFIKVS